MPTSSALANASRAFSSSDFALGALVLTRSVETSLGLTHLSSDVALTSLDGVVGATGSGAGFWGSGFGAEISDVPQRKQYFLVGRLAFPHLAHVLSFNHPLFIAHQTCTKLIL
jgi:hypothetical protein